VSVNVDVVRDNVQVTVQDTGLGIPTSDLPHIFDKYYQASTKPTGGEMGTGLGLAIVREIVLAHKGHIDVTSERDRGTTFVVSLPLKPLLQVPAGGTARRQMASAAQTPALAGQEA
jgi:two-component system sensor histidine kinase ResE